MSNESYNKIVNTSLQSVSGDVAAAAGVPGLGASFRVLKGSFAPTNTDVYPLLDNQGNQVMLGEYDSVSFLGVRNNNTDTMTTNVDVYRATTSLGNDTMLGGAANGVVPSNPSFAGDEKFVNVCASEGIMQGTLDVTLYVLNM